MEACTHSCRTIHFKPSLHPSRTSSRVRCSSHWHWPHVLALMPKTLCVYCLQQRDCRSASPAGNPGRHRLGAPFLVHALFFLVKPAGKAAGGHPRSEGVRLVEYKVRNNRVVASGTKRTPPFEHGHEIVRMNGTLPAESPAVYCTRQQKLHPSQSHLCRSMAQTLPDVAAAPPPWRPCRDASVASFTLEAAANPAATRPIVFATGDVKVSPAFLHAALPSFGGVACAEADAAEASSVLFLVSPALASQKLPLGDAGRSAEPLPLGFCCSG